MKKLLLSIILLLSLINSYGQGVSIQSAAGGSQLDVAYLKQCNVQVLRIQIQPLS